MSFLSIEKNVKKIKAKKVFLRVDFNVPVDNGRIKDDTKIISALPTIRFLLRYKTSIIIATHLGRPKKNKDKKYSTEVLAKKLNKLLGGNKVKFANGLNEKKVQEKAQKLKQGKILFLENLRFSKKEEKNDKKFAKSLAQMADVYVNDAFSVCHRKHASVSAISKIIPSFKGLLLSSEIANLDKIKHPKRPLVVLIGGAKIKTKINLIKNFESKALKILIGGALANNFFKAEGLEIGKSLFDKESVKIAKTLKSKKIVLPSDVIVKNKYGKPELKNTYDVLKADQILDIGPMAIKEFSEYIKKANTLVWNGPLGMFEEKDYKHGTLSLVSAFVSRSKGRAFGVIGGGETIEVLKMAKAQGDVDWVSTGGGAMLAYLGGEEMPGL